MLRAKLRSLRKGLLHRSRVEEGMADELEFHIQSRADTLMASGMSRDAALRQARLELGSTEKYKEEMRGARGLRLLDECWGDIKYASRVLWKSPAFSLAAILTLSLGITANSAVFSLVNEVFFRKLPVGHPDELVQFDWLIPESGQRQIMMAGYSGNGRRDPEIGRTAMTSFSFKTFEWIRDGNRTLSDVVAFNPMSGPINVVSDGSAEIAKGQLVTGNYFTALQVPAAAGRIIQPPDDQIDAQPVAMMSYRYWQDRFDRSTAVIGKTIGINGASFILVGVTPEGFFGVELGAEPDLWLPFRTQSRITSDGRTPEAWEWWVQMMGRARPGVTRSEIAADLQPVFEASVIESYDTRPERYRGASYSQRTVIPSLSVNDGSRGPIPLRRHYSPLLSTLLAASGLILLIVCANIANLLLARASSRQAEISIRLAIGAGRRRLVRQLLTESLLLALCGGVGGALLTIWSKNFVSWLPDSGEAVLAITPALDWRVMAFTVGLSVITGLLFGVFPGIRATKSDLSPTMRSNKNRGGSSGLLVSKSLLITQVAICLVLLVGAGLIVRSVHNLLTADIGFNAQNVVLFTVNPQLNKYDKARIEQLYDELITGLESVPGVQSATFSATRPIRGGGTWFSVTANDTPSEHERLDAYLHRIGQKFFETMQMPLVMGRTLTPQDAGTEPKAVINQQLAYRLFKDENPIGKRFRYAASSMQDLPAFEVVGVVRDARYHKMEAGNPPTMYVPFVGASQATFEVRTLIRPTVVMPAIRDAVAKVDRNLPLIDLSTQEDQIRSQIGLYRMFAAFSTIFGVFAVLMSCIGLYGILSYSVTRSINEIGIRMALGAQPSDVIRHVMKGTWFVTVIGIVIGLAAALATTRFLAGWLLYEVKANDPIAIAIAVTIIVSVSALAGYLPARRGSRIDPMQALRYE